MRHVYFTLILALACVFALPLHPAAAAEKADKEISIGFIYIAPVGKEGWSYSHDVARKKLDAMPNVTTSFVEAVPVGADAERVIAGMARKNTDIILATSFGYMDSIAKIAKQFPNLDFMHATGFKTEKNMSNYMGRMYQARYLTGIIAGSMTKSGKIGYVAAFPIPEVIRGINAFTLGVRSVNPKAKVHVVWTNSWYDPAGEKETAKSLIDVGCDIIAQHQDTGGAQEAAEEAGIYSIGYNSDMSGTAPKAHLTSAVWNWEPIYTMMLEKIRNGTWKHGAYWYGIETDVVGLAPYSDAVSQALRTKVAKAKAELIDGSLKIFKGPIKDQAGKVHVPAGTVLTDKEMSSMLWFVQGVIGKI